MGYATPEERAKGISDTPVYMDGKGRFLLDGMEPVRLTFDMGKGQKPLCILDKGTREIEK